MVEIEYWEDGYIHREALAIEKEANKIASRVAYDGRDEAHIAVPRTLSVGTSTTWFKVQRVRTSVPAYASVMLIDVGATLQFRHMSRRQFLC